VAAIGANGQVWEIYWEDGFGQSLERMNITWETFDRLGRFGVDFVLHQDPYEPQSTFPIEGTDSRVLRTAFHFPDLPAMAISYVTDDAARAVTVQGAEPVWDDDFEPLPPPKKQGWIL
jgi:hypothetical protein